MKVAEILRSMAEILDAKDELIARNKNKTNGQAEQKPMVPPLQAKVELLKKSVGVDSVYDDEDEDDTDGNDSEIKLIRKYAGLSPTKIISSEDNDIMD